MRQNAKKASAMYGEFSTNTFVVFEMSSWCAGALHVLTFQHFPKFFWQRRWRNHMCVFVVGGPGVCSGRLWSREGANTAILGAVPVVCCKSEFYTVNCSFWPNVFVSVSCPWFLFCFFLTQKCEDLQTCAMSADVETGRSKQSHVFQAARPVEITYGRGENSIARWPISYNLVSRCPTCKKK